MSRLSKIPRKILEKLKNVYDSLSFSLLAWMLILAGLVVYGCQSSSGRGKFGDALIVADLRYMQHNGELSGVWSFYQRDQKDSLIPDAQRHEFVINGQKAQSEKVKNNYHMYLVADTFISQNLNVQIGPDQRVFSMDIPKVPVIEAESLDPSMDWSVRWDTAGYSDQDSVTIVVTDQESHTVMSKAGAAEGEIVVPVTHMFSLIPGEGFYYMISSSSRFKDMDGVDLRYRIEVYSDDTALSIVGE